MGGQLGVPGGGVLPTCGFVVEGPAWGPLVACVLQELHAPAQGWCQRFPLFPSPPPLPARSRSRAVVTSVTSGSLSGPVGVCLASVPPCRFRPCLVVSSLCVHTGPSLCWSQQPGPGRHVAAWAHVVRPRRAASRWAGVAATGDGGAGRGGPLTAVLPAPRMWRGWSWNAPPSCRTCSPSAPAAPSRTPCWWPCSPSSPATCGACAKARRGRRCTAG